MKRFILATIILSVLALPCDAAHRKAKHVVMIGVDGMSSSIMRDFPKEEIPNISWLIENGASTYGKRSVMPSASAINWATIFMGVPTEMHAYNRWNSKEPAIPAAQVGPNGMPSTIYTVLRERRPNVETGVTYNWDGIAYVVDTTAISYYVYVQASDKKGSNYSTEGYVEKYALPYIKDKKPAFYTLYFGEVDHQGHAHGWGSEEYREAVRTVDKCIGMVIQALKDAGIFKDTMIVVTSDHGGINKGHGKFSIEELESPFIVYGRKVKSAYDIPVPMMQYDVPAVMLYALGEDIPDWWVGRPLKCIFK